MRAPKRTRAHTPHTLIHACAQIFQSHFLQVHSGGSDRMLCFYHLNYFLHLHLSLLQARSTNMERAAQLTMSLGGLL